MSAWEKDLAQREAEASGEPAEEPPFRWHNTIEAAVMYVAGIFLGSLTILALIKWVNW